MAQQQLTTLCIIAMTLSFGSVLGQREGYGMPVWPEPGCNTPCNEIIDPVCGVNKTGHDLTFPNPCEFQAAQCLSPSSEWSIAKTGQCDPNCAVPCPRVVNYPVCGIDKNGNKRNFGHICDLLHFAACLAPERDWKTHMVGECDAPKYVLL